MLSGYVREFTARLATSQSFSLQVQAVLLRELFEMAVRTGKPVECLKEVKIVTNALAWHSVKKQQKQTKKG